MHTKIMGTDYGPADRPRRFGDLVHDDERGKLSELWSLRKTLEVATILAAGNAASGRRGMTSHSICHRIQMARALATYIQDA
jgi:hypothetical protein